MLAILTVSMAPRNSRQVKYVLRGLDMRGNVEEACKVLRPSTKAAEARAHGIEALEYLSQIVEVRRICIYIYIVYSYM